MKQLSEIFVSSLKIGALTFGGGYAMLPILQREAAENRGWCSQEEIANWYALAQCLPGIIMVNTLAFLGHKKRGTAGAAAAAIGAIMPSLVIITLIAGLISAFADIPAVSNAFAGIRVCVCVLIFNSILKLWKSAVADSAELVIFLAVTIGSLFLDVSPVLFVVLSAAAGIVLTLLGAGREAKK